MRHPSRMPMWPQQCELNLTSVYPLRWFVTQTLGTHTCLVRCWATMRGIRATCSSLSVRCSSGSPKKRGFSAVRWKTLLLVIVLLPRRSSLFPRGSSLDHDLRPRLLALLESRSIAHDELARSGRMQQAL